MKRIRTIAIISIIIVTLFTLAGCPALMNKPPELEIADFTINEGETLNINLDNYSSDKDGDKLTYTKISGVGNIQENTYTYTPDYDESGTHDVTIKAEDNKGGEVQDGFTIEVVNVNATPTLNIPDQQLVEGETLTLDLLDYTTDPDATDTFSYTLLSGVGSITDNIYTYTATYTDEGTKTVTIKVEDDEGTFSEDTFIIVIGNINLPPKAEINFTPTNPEEGEKVYFDASNSTDEKDGPETLLTRWDFNGDGEWEIRYDEEVFANEEVTYTFNNAGAFTINLEIKDSDGTTDIAQEAIDINLAQPSSPYISKVEENNVTINWTDNSNSEDGFKIYVDEVYKTEVNANIETASFDIDTSATRTIKIICYKEAFESLPAEIVLGKQKEVVTKYKEVSITIPASHLGKKVTLETVKDPPDLPEGSDSISKAYNIVVEDIPDDATSTPIGINFESVFEKMEEADFNKTENADVPVILHYEDETGTWIPLYTVIDNDGNYTTYTKDFSTFELVLVDPNSNMFNQSVKDYSVKTYGLKFRNFGTSSPIFDVGDNFYPVNNNGGHCYGMTVTSLGAWKEKLGFVDPFFDDKCSTPKFIIQKHSYMDYRLSCTPIIEFVGYEQDHQLLSNILNKLKNIQYFKSNIANANDAYSILSTKENSPVVLKLFGYVEDVYDRDNDGDTTEKISIGHTVLAYVVNVSRSDPMYSMNDNYTFRIYDPNFPDEPQKLKIEKGVIVDYYSRYNYLITDIYSTNNRPKKLEDLENTLDESYSPWLKDIYYYINDNVCKVFWWNFCRPDKTEPSTQYIERKDDDKFEIINTINDMSTNYFNDYNVQTNKKYEYIVSRSDGKSSPSMAVYTQYFETLPSSGSTVNNEGFTVVFPQFEGIKVMIYSFYFEDGEWKSLKSNSDFDNVIEFDQDDCKKLFSNTESRLIRFAKRNFNNETYNDTYSVRDVVFYGVDNIPPTITKVSGPSGTIDESSSTFTWDGNDSDGTVDHYEYRKDYGSWVNYGTSESYTWNGYTEGSHTFEVRAQDNDGAYSNIISWSFTYDKGNESPTVTKISGPSGTIDESSSTFTWYGEDSDGEIDHYEYRKDYGSWVNYGTSESYTWNGYTEGSHTFEVRAQDNDGAYSDPVEWNFTYSVGSSVSGKIIDASTGAGIEGATVQCDTVQTTSQSNGNYILSNIPYGTRTINASKQGYIANSRTIVVDGNETNIDISLSPVIQAEQLRFVLSWGANPSDLDSHLLVPTSDSNPCQGYHVFYSARGSQDNYPYALLDVDDTDGYGPETVTIYDRINQLYKYYVHHYSGYGSLKTSGASVKIYSGSSLISRFDVPTSGEGAYWYVCDISTNGRIIEKNTIQNEAPTIECNTPPTITKVSGPSGTIDESSSTFTWDGNDSDGTVDHYEYRKDGASWVNYGTSESYPWSGYTEGSHTFEVRAQDNDGAYSNIISWSFTYDKGNESPTVTKVSGPSGTIKESSSTFTWDGNDSDGTIDHYEYRKDGGSWVNYGTSESYSWTGYTEGSHTFEVRAQDNDGAYSNIISWSFTYDKGNESPTVTKISGPSGTIDESSSTFTWDGNDSDGTVDHYEYRKDGASWVNYGTSESYPWSGYTEGSHTFEVRAQDNDSAYSNIISWSFTYEPSVIFAEDFETGNFSAHNWTLGGDAQPFVQSDEVNDGTYAVQFGNIDHSQSSYLEIEVTLENDAAISFHRKTSSQFTYDHLQFYIDDVFAGEWSGDLGWHQVIREIPSGTHTLKWEYTKNSRSDSYEDTAWIDYITIVDDMNLGEEVNVPDSNLKSIILSYLGKNPQATEPLMKELSQKKEKENLEELETREYYSIQQEKVEIAPQLLTYDSGKIYAKELLDFVEFAAVKNNISDITSVEYMINLQYLALYTNQITDITPLENLTNLERLDLSLNQITDITPLQNLTNLRELYLYHNQITDLTSLQNMTNLNFLYLVYNQITDITPLQNMTNLRTLNLAYNEITDITPLQNLNNLEQLEVYNNQIADLTPLQNLTNLWWLNLDNNNISDLTPLQNLTNLVWLYLDNNNIYDLTPLQNLTNLYYLPLDNNNIEDIQSLVDNAGIGFGDEVYIRNNYLDISAGSEDMEDINTLIDRGVNVYYDPQK